MPPIDIKSCEEHTRSPGGYAFQTVETTRAIYEKNFRDKVQYNVNNPLGMVLDNNPSIQICIDIGSGVGWTASLMAATRREVYAIEPSAEAMVLAKAVSENTNIAWIHGYAEDGLRTLSFSEPVLINTSCVLSHLDDSAVEAICQQICRIARAGSVLTCSELWGPENHSPFWHTRTKEWWKKNLENFDLTFLETYPLTFQAPGRFVGFYGIKTGTL